MKSLFTIFAHIVFVSTTLGQITFKTGNTEMESDLNGINSDAKLDLGKFKLNMSTSYNVSTQKIDHMFSLNMQPAEVMLALEIANIVKKPADDVVNCYTKNKSKGWGEIAKEMGIKPGSAEFHQLKSTMKTKHGNGKGKGNSDNDENKGNSSHGKGNGNPHGNGKGKK